MKDGTIPVRAATQTSINILAIFLVLTIICLVIFIIYSINYWSDIERKRRYHTHFCTPEKSAIKIPNREILNDENIAQITKLQDQITKLQNQISEIKSPRRTVSEDPLVGDLEGSGSLSSSATKDTSKN